MAEYINQEIMTEKKFLQLLVFCLNTQITMRSTMQLGFSREANLSDLTEIKCNV